METAKVGQAVDICMVAPAVHSDITYNTRFYYPAKSLATHGWDVVMVSVVLEATVSAPKLNVDGFAIRHVTSHILQNWPLGKMGFVIRLLVAYLKAARQLRIINARVYHARDFTGLVIVFLAGIWKRPVVYDSTEIYFDRPMAFLTRFLSPLLRRIRGLLARRASQVVVTSDGHARVLQAQLNIPYPVVIYNALICARLI